LFGLVGSIGVACNIILAILLVKFLHMNFKQAQILGASITIAINFLLNNEITFRFTRLRGVRLAQGLGLFYVFCSVGLLEQVALANALQQIGVHWLVATLVGVLIGSVWNYTMAFLLVWHVSRRRTERLQFAYAKAAWLEEFSPAKKAAP
jgi:dolichol-phosphate mannosyltransferase